MKITSGGENYYGKSNEHENTDLNFKCSKRQIFVEKLFYCYAHIFDTQKNGIIKNKATQNGIYVSPQNENTQNIICNFR